MFAALRKRKAVRVAAIPFPTTHAPLRLVESQKQRSYEEVAHLIGFTPAELVHAQLLEFFEVEGVKLYDYNEVSAWLTGKKEQAKATHWCWRALREKDVMSCRWGWEVDRFNDGYYLPTDWGCRQYDRLVPMHVLEKVAKIEAKFGDRVKFFVSDYASSKADPFIMVRPAMCHSSTRPEHSLIFDVWNEPGFGV